MGCWPSGLLPFSIHFCDARSIGIAELPLWLTIEVSVFFHFSFLNDILNSTYQISIIYIGIGTETQPMFAVVEIDIPTQDPDGEKRQDANLEANRRTFRVC